MTNAPEAAAPLAGIRVVDLSERSVPAALIGLVLSDCGAEVIRVEKPGGDDLRQLDASNVWFRGQQSVTAGEGGLDDTALRKLCESADILIDTSQAWVDKQFEYRAPFPRRQIYCLVTAEPFDADAIAAGERPSGAVYSELAEARWGFMFIQDRHRGTGPAYLAWPHAAFGAAWLGLAGILAALLNRQRSGQGRVVTTSLLDGLAALNTHRWIGGGDPPLEPWPSYSSLTRMGDAVMIIALLPCADGKWLQINSGAQGAANKLFAALGRGDLVDPRYDANPGSTFRTKADADSFWNDLPGIIATRTADAWVDILRPLDVSVMRVRMPGEIFEEEGVRTQGLAAADGDETQFGHSVRFAEPWGPPRLAAPEAGEQNACHRDAAPLPADAREQVPMGDGAAILEGLTILDLGIHIAGPFASRILADCGARVIKISERNPQVGRLVLGNSLGINRGKESVQIDLKTERGRNLFLKIVEKADVVHHNLRQGVFERLGFDFEVLKGANPQVVYCHSSGYGNLGPWHDLPAWGPLIDAVSGMLARAGGAGNPPMQYATHVDYGAALNAAPMLLLALFAKGRSGAGQVIEIPQLSGAMFAMSDARILNGRLHQSFAVDADQNGHAPTNCLYRTRDGKLLLSCWSEREWTAAHTALGLTADASYGSARGRLPDAREQEGALARAIAQRSTADLAALWQAAGVPCQEPQVVPAEGLLNEDLERLNLVVRYDHPRAGQVFEIGHTIRFSGTAFHHTRPFPVLGAQTRQVLGEIGLDSAQIDTLFADQIVFEDKAAAPAKAEPVTPPASATKTVATVGMTLKSAVDGANLMIVRAPKEPVSIRCAGLAMLGPKDVAPTDASTGGAGEPLLLGKRYQHEPSGLELLCTRSGAGPLEIEGLTLAPMQPKALPSSD
jgi:crotonobetainyl-CoA:carnitine CoA-transferase CaiB-like acyl-CoA transferase